MKKLLCGALLALTMGTAASAAVTDCTTFTLDVPDRWTISGGDGAVTLLAPDRSAALSIVLRDGGGLTASALASSLSADMRGAKPKKEGVGYVFFFRNAHGVPGKCIVMRDGDAMKIITVTGYHAAFGEIMASFRKK